MGYDHVLVSRLVEETTHLREKLANLVTTQTGNTEAHMHEGILYCKEVFEFYTKLKLIHPQLEIGVVRGAFGGVIGGGATFAWLYVPTQQYAMLKIGYGRFRIGKDCLPAYMIYARGVQNSKYKDWRDQHYMQHSENINTIVAQAKKQLRPYTQAEEAAMTISVFRGLVYADKSAALAAKMRASDNIRFAVQSDVLDELVGLRQAGHVFASRKLCEAVDEYIAKKKAAAEEEALHAHAWYVRIIDRCGEQMAEVLDIYDVAQKDAEDITNSAALIKRYKLDEIPETLAGRITLLNMAGVNNGVSGVGLKLNDRAYWVERRGDE